MLVDDLADRQEPGQLFDPNHKCVGPSMIGGSASEYEERQAFYKWMDVYLE